LGCDVFHNTGVLGDGAQYKLSPIAWEPVNFLGQFTFDPGNARPLSDRRPL
jgi:hypothetical protein